MEVVVPVRSPDFGFDSQIYAVAPPTPKLMGDCYFSAPTSPTRITELDLDDFDELLIPESTTNSLATVPFAWEEKPGVPKSFTKYDNFSSDISGEFNRYSSASVENLFHDGMGLNGPDGPNGLNGPNSRENRGREREVVSRLPSSRSRRTRSLPPVRGLEQPPKSDCTTLAVSGSGKGSKKWSFMDLFLFRSASDGRALDNDPLKKYSAIFRKHDEDFRNSSMRSDRGSGSGSGSGSKRRGKVSAHELHYNVNRAVSNDMKKKTFLPYKQGILGRLAFNPTVNALANGFGFSHNNNN
ncbi:uncharacterized protein [Rutidosis leptorrhynchoides]|uniref:uncharacterized protein n=1 Tax=Rutidosis leptorrhynchoides TaxID=125765 RepID=UPI003A9A0711